MEHIATLLFDSLTSRRRDGLRGYGFASRQLLFSTASFDIDIELTPVNRQISLVGQVLSRDTRSILGEATIYYNHAPGSRALLTRHGEFHFMLAEPGGYSLRLLVDDDIIRIPEFAVTL
jgi:hypothetical protein